MSIKKIFLKVLLLAVATMITGCFSSNPKDIEAFVKPYQKTVVADNYILQPPDEIQVFCTSVPELHEQTQIIRPDGKISFEGLGEVQAAGYTPEQLTQAIKDKASSLYTLPGEKPIDARIMVYESSVYYVLGQVYFPGPKDATGRVTVLQAVAESHPTTLAWLERVQVVRPSVDKNTKPKIFELNYNRMIAHGDASKNVLLQEGDIVFVPPTVLAAIGLKVEELVSPIGRAFSTVNVVSGPPTER